MEVTEVALNIFVLFNWLGGRTLSLFLNDLHLFVAIAAVAKRKT